MSNFERLHEAWNAYRTHQSEVSARRHRWYQAIGEIHQAFETVPNIIPSCTGSTKEKDVRFELPDNRGKLTYDIQPDGFVQVLLIVPDPKDAGAMPYIASAGYLDPRRITDDMVFGHVADLVEFRRRAESGELPAQPPRSE